MSLSLKTINKRGASVDSIYVMLLCFGAIIGFLVIALIWASLANASSLWTAGTVSDHLKSAGNTYVDSLDFIFLMFYFGAHLMVILLLFLLRSHPAMIVVAIFFMILMVIVGAALANGWDSVKATSPLSTYVSSFPIGNAIMSKLPFYELIWGVLTLIVGYGFARSGMYA